MRLDRRGFLAFLSGGTLAWPRAVQALARDLERGGEPDDELFWGVVRGQFLIPSDRIYLNNGTLGPSPLVAVEAVAEHTRRVAATYPPGVAWDDVKAAMAALVGGEPEGLRLSAQHHRGDELRGQRPRGRGRRRGAHHGPRAHRRARTVEARDHPTPGEAGGGEPASPRLRPPRSCWRRCGRASRRPTRVVSVSHVTFTNGTVMPVEALARRCSEAGVVLAVDGAHPPGMMRVDLDALGMDFYASSPAQVDARAPGQWPPVPHPALAGEALADVGLGRVGRPLARRAAIQPSRDLRRVPAGRAPGRGGVPPGHRDRPDRGPGPLAPAPSAGRLEPGAGCAPWSRPRTRRFAPAWSRSRWRALPRWTSRHTWRRSPRCAPGSCPKYGYGYMRLSTHIYNAPAEIDRTLELLDDAARTGVPSRNDHP